MIYSICILFVLSLSVSAALFVSPYFREGELPGENSTEAYARFKLDNANHHVYSAGFLRTDAYYNNNEQRWVRAQVLPIGICLKQGNSGGSAVINQIMMGSSYLLRVTHVYAGINCTGDFIVLMLKVPIVNIVDNFQHVVRHMGSMGKALKIKSQAQKGLVITSYWSSDGCTGEAAQYDLVSTVEYIVYDDPISSCGFFECFENVELMVLRLFGSNYGEALPFCNGDFYNSDAAVRSPYKTFKQRFQCTQEEQVDFPLFQTVRCVGP